MKVVLIVATFALALMFYSICNISSRCSREEERRELERIMDEYAKSKEKKETR